MFLDYTLVICNFKVRSTGDGTAHSNKPVVHLFDVPGLAAAFSIGGAINGKHCLKYQIELFVCSLVFVLVSLLDCFK